VRVTGDGGSLSVSERWDLTFGSIVWFGATLATGVLIGVLGAWLAGWHPSIDNLLPAFGVWAAIAILSGTRHLGRFDKASGHWTIAWRSRSPRRWEGPLSSVSGLEVAPGLFWTSVWLLTSRARVCLARSPRFLGVARLARQAEPVASFLGVAVTVRQP
jgi:hypothetical protein